MKRFLIGLMVAAVAAIGFGSPASAAAKLQTFANSGATVTPGTDGASATIVLDPSGATPYPNFGGVFVNAKDQGNKLLSAVSFSFVSTGDVAGGAPRFSIPINTSGGGSSVAGYAFLDAAGCGAVVGPNPTMVSTTVSTSVGTCHVNFQGVDYAKNGWFEFAAANPTYRIAAGAIPFIIADGTAGTYKVSSIVLR
jgi:hypothetical protein